MPQMAPSLWLLIFIFSFLLIMFMIMNLYFSTKETKKIFSPQEKTSYQWLW